MQRRHFYHLQMWAVRKKGRKSQIREFAVLKKSEGFTQMWQFANLLFADPLFFWNLGFAICEHIFCGLKYSEIDTFSPYKYRLQSTIKMKFGLTDLRPNFKVFCHEKDEFSKVGVSSSWIYGLINKKIMDLSFAA